MYSKLIRRRTSSVDNVSPKRSIASNRNYCSKTLKYLICLLVIYYLNIFLSLKYSHWNEKSFVDESYLTMQQFDYFQIENNPQLFLGSPKYRLDKQFLIENRYFCYQTQHLLVPNYPRILILIKSSTDHFQQRQSIRLTWANKLFLAVYDVKIAFVLGKTFLFLFFFCYDKMFVN